MTSKFQCTRNECNGDDCCPDGVKCNPPIRSIKTYGIKCHREEREKFQPLVDAMREFVDRCDRGEIHSVYTYDKFKELLKGVEE
jgi:hypothetical protein